MLLRKSTALVAWEHWLSFYTEVNNVGPTEFTDVWPLINTGHIHRGLSDETLKLGRLHYTRKIKNKILSKKSIRSTILVTNQPSNITGEFVHTFNFVYRFNSHVQGWLPNRCVVYTHWQIWFTNKNLDCSQNSENFFSSVQNDLKTHRCKAG